MSKLKTVWDAVNELRGDLKSMLAFHPDHKSLWFEINKANYLLQYTENYTLEGCFHKYVCTIPEFNALVEEMTLGLDVNPVNHGHYLNYVYADKTPLEKEALDSIINKPLFYTQEMADNGELLSVGMKAMINGFEREILLGPDSDGDYITMNGEGSYDFDSANQFKPIDTRTKKEKAIDEIESELSKIAYSTRSALELAYDEWVSE